MKSLKSSQKKSSPLRVLLIGVPMAALIVWALVIVVSYLSRPNYAQEMVKLVGNSLIKGGATYACDGGDDGRGIDNRTPYYRAYYRVQKGASEAATLLQKATSENGYHLTHASPTNRGPLGAVADLYIDKWYFDDTSKKNGYDELKNGKVVLMAVVDGPGSEDTCNSGKTKVDSGHSLIGVEVQLPEFK